MRGQGEEGKRREGKERNKEEGEMEDYDHHLYPPQRKVLSQGANATVLPSKYNTRNW